MKTYDETDHDAVKELLIGHRVAKVSATTLELDDGRLLELAGNEGGCSCGAGDYDLTELNGVDNVITAVEFVDSEGRYQIFVFAENVKVNLATFEGTDGNGYYGTGYSIQVRDAA